MTVRTKSIITTLIIIIVFAALQFIDITNIIPINQEISKALIISLLFFIGLYWVLGFNVSGARLITILGSPSLVVFIQALFLELVVFQSIGRLTEKTFSLIVLGFFGISIHFLMLTTNILNVSYISKIPLAQAAKAANFIYTLFTAYFSFLWIMQSGLMEVLQILLFTAVVFFFTFTMFWFKKESFRQLIGETLAVIVFMITVFVFFLIWPLSAEVASMFYILIFYILLGLGLEERETTSVLMRVEYFILLGIGVSLIVGLAVWGINGSIF